MLGGVILGLNRRLCLIVALETAISMAVLKSVAPSTKHQQKWRHWTRRHMRKAAFRHRWQKRSCDTALA